MIANWWIAIVLAYKLRGYRPQPVTVARVREWFGQFPRGQHAALRQVLRAVRYVDERRMVSELHELNERLLRKLDRAGVPANHVIYVSFDDAGSSSGAILNLLRDSSRLEARKCRLIDAKDTGGLHRVTSELENGAIVYVDDFIGTGNQFCKTREFAAQFIVGNFSEFLLAHTICEEGISELSRRNSVEPVPCNVHGRSERPLHELGSILSEGNKEALRRYCLALHKKFGLGYRMMATMVVYYRNAPNTVPLMIRGSLGQAVCRGILPRTTDLDAA